MIRKIIITIAIVLLVITAGVVGWFLGFRDGVTRSTADAGMYLATYYQALKDNDPAYAAQQLDYLTQNTVIHLLNGQHNFPLYFENPFRAQAVLSELRTAWTIPQHIPWDAMRYPYESASADYKTLYEQIAPVDPKRQVSKRRH